MQQVLFHIPILQNQFGPEGIPIHGFGAMLFLTFVICMNFAVRRGRLGGVSADRIQDLSLVLLVSGIVGARIFYMIQYKVPFSQFFKIWEGGIVFYGSVLGGTIGYIVLYYYVLRRLKISTWVLADAIAPALAMGLVLGRVGCLLNGCCYGQVASSECASLEFPLLTGPVRSTVAQKYSYQTTLGFSSIDRSEENDPRTIVDKVEADSQALRAGLQPGDKILKFNGQDNGLLILFLTTPSGLDSVRKIEKDLGKLTEIDPVSENSQGLYTFLVTSPNLYLLAKDEFSKIPGVRQLSATDLLSYQLRNWPKGKAKVQFTVERNKEVIELPEYTPRSLGLQPTQLYESISMILMVFLLVSFYPFRRHDGQVMVLLMFGYAIHRFLNEMLRNDTDPIFDFVSLTASMTVSILVFAGAILLELYLRKTQPRRTV
ncbi:prolipoprotein diacylglyceryl transferase [Telmatocola sphagniphila]|uniref:Phosphatidylglycerol--prolipoprotein diacylglyceryl transferase n=1 Tax=Telmatocola sphagniphila TaxID=1123043 RepID=A0A8E6B5M8_9BACT|nr:prolipoprotein diacylglyceryl transferase family protein [Telmatocola sphagniphila]QVL32595.1 prolipoprotein diacylglyceryl transferase [Telmatocola sphagniphila]